jgi:preprotein translocase subunit SecD
VLYRVALFAGLAVVAIVLLLPTFVRPAPSWLPWRQPVRLGLDLQGGTHLLYGVDIEQAIDRSVDRSMQDLERELRDAQIGASSVEVTGRTIHIRLANKDRRRDVDDVVKGRFPGLVRATPTEGEDDDLAFTDRAARGPAPARERPRAALKIIRQSHRPVRRRGADGAGAGQRRDRRPAPRHPGSAARERS